ncbi:MAG: secretion system protein E [Candidatus Methanogaster sp.]|uniref:Secretion system protein E n=1 Tax=Candidatus Methanogaster sp. TaxID=3386292 RepID=A0AC61L4K0_9EURY|nr:MAG: secretion system protein E [ANME-2 cluster archaeon]
MESLPFEPNVSEAHGADLRQCGLYRMLPPDAKKFLNAEENHHVLDYIHMLPLDEIGVPKFYPELSRDLKKIAKPNIIYPAGDGVSIHIYPDKEDVRNYYIPVEPTLFASVDELLIEVEEALVDIVDVLEITTEDMDSKKALLEEGLNDVCIIEDGRDVGEEGGLKKKIFDRIHGFASTTKNKKVHVTPDEFKKVKYYLFKDKIGMGPLQPLLMDPYIEDISCSGVGRIFVEHKIFSGLKTSITFGSIADLDSYVIRMSEKIGKPITYRDPIVDAALPDGSRINIVFGEDVSKRGSNFTIRKFSETPLSLLNIIDFQTLNYKMAAYLWMLLGAGMNCFVVGETASGKTTTLNAMTTCIQADAKVISIEDTPELQVPHKNWLREVTRGSGDGGSSDVTMFDLLKAALRQRPNEIIIGEIRGAEGNIAFQAMQTGHPAMATFHAASVEKLIQRLTGDPINVPKTYIDNLNLVVIQNAVNVPGKGMARRITSINEIIGYDPSSQAFSFIETFQWDASKDVFKFTGKNNSYLLENKIAPKRGLPKNKRRRIYKELDRREKVLRKVHDAGVLGFYELFAMMGRAEEEGLV